ncbi:MAG: hypothetical protein PHG95_02475 [Patescibacteria group bacterium]|nr:hypothetical protein [Patescibacteria group bacterium]
MLSYLHNLHVKNPLWLSVSEAAKLGGVTDKTIRRALKAEHDGLKFKISKNRYQIELSSLLIYLHRNTKLKNKLSDFGLGQYWPPEKER